MAGLGKLIRWHTRLRPGLEVVDVYKMLYQSVYGIKHFLQSEARRCLDEELSQVDVSLLAEEPLVESISVDDSIVRVNLRAFKVNKLPVDKLFIAMTTSSNEIVGSQKIFLKLWKQFKNLVEAGKLSFNMSDLEDLDDRAKREKYPAYHHSANYRRRYRPAYRVVKKTVFKEIFSGNLKKTQEDNSLYSFAITEK